MDDKINLYTVKRLTLEFYRHYQTREDTIQAVRDNIFHYHVKSTGETAREFESLIPFMNEIMDSADTEKSKRRILASLVASTAQGIIDSLVSEGVVEIPEIADLRGTANGRVIICFKDMDMMINAPLDHIKARLIRKFSSK